MSSAHKAQSLCGGGGGAAAAAAADASVSHVFTAMAEADERVAQQACEHDAQLRATSMTSTMSPCSGGDVSTVVADVHTHTPRAGHGGATATANAAAAAATSVPHSDERVVFVRHCSSSGMPIELCYRCFGCPEQRRPVVLLICGLNMQLTAWDEAFCDDLVRAGFFVVCYDNRDSGYSTKIASTGSVVGPRLLLPRRWASLLGERLPYTIEDMAKDGLALLDAMHVPCAHVLGISMGGMIAQTMALLAPSRVLSLTSIMSTTNAPDLPDAQLWVKLWMLRSPPRHCTLEQLLEFREATLRRLLQRALPLDTAYFKARYLLSLRRSAYAAGLLRHAAAIRRSSGRDAALRTLRVPALVVHGAQDVVVPPVHGYRTATVLRYSRLLVIKNMGHYLHPAFFATIVRAFAGMAACTVGPGFDLAVDNNKNNNNNNDNKNNDNNNDHVGVCDEWATTTSRPDTKDTSAHTSSPSVSSSRAFPSAAADAADATCTQTTTHMVTSNGDAHDARAATLATVASPTTSACDRAATTAEAASTATIASMATLLSTVVLTPASPVGRAVRTSVMAAVPTSGHPATPQAAMLDLHTDADTTATTTTTVECVADAAPTHAAVQPFVPGAPSRWNDAPPLLHSAADVAAKVFVCPTLVGVPVASYMQPHPRYTNNNSSSGKSATMTAATTQASTTHGSEHAAECDAQLVPPSPLPATSSTVTCVGANATAATAAATTLAVAMTTATADAASATAAAVDAQPPRNDDAATAATLPCVLAHTTLRDNADNNAAAAAVVEDGDDSALLASLVASSADVTVTMLPPVITDAATMPLLAAATGIDDDDDDEDEDTDGAAATAKDTTSAVM